VLRLLVAVNFPGSPILLIPMMEALSSSETSIFIRAARRNISEDAILEEKNNIRLNKNKLMPFSVMMVVVVVVVVVVELETVSYV
jgi:hypothetical protein